MHKMEFSSNILGQRRLGLVAIAAMTTLAPTSFAQQKATSGGLTKSGGASSGPVKAHNEQGRNTPAAANTIGLAGDTTGKSVDSPHTEIERLLSGDSGGGGSGGSGMSGDLIDPVDDVLDRMVNAQDTPRRDLVLAQPGRWVAPSGTMPADLGFGSTRVGALPPSQPIPAPTFVPGLAALLLLRRRRNHAG